jgi:hypothetical protein
VKTLCSDWRAVAALLAATAAATAAGWYVYAARVNAYDAKVEAELADPVVTWSRAWLVPDHASRADVMHGIQVQFCKEVAINRLPIRAWTVQDFVPAVMVDGALKPINGGHHPAGIHPVHLPAGPPGEDGKWRVGPGCRVDPNGLVRLDSTMTVGLWAFVADTHAVTWAGEVKAPMMILAPFEVTP